MIKNWTLDLRMLFIPTQWIKAWIYLLRAIFIHNWLSHDDWRALLNLFRELRINVELQDMHTTNKNVVLLNEAEKEPIMNQSLDTPDMTYQTSVDEVRTKDDQKVWRFSIRDFILWYFWKVHVV